MKFIDKINPFYKCISLIISCILLSFTYSIELNIIVFFTYFLLTLFCSSTKFSNLIMFLIPVFLIAIGLYFTGAIFGTSEVTVYEIGISENMYLTSSYNGLQLSTRVFAFSGIGMMFTFTTNNIHFIYSLMEQGKLPPKFAYGVLASFHLMPNIKREFDCIKFALEVRGVKCHPLAFKPIFSMFVNGVLWADALAMAMESKGFDVNNKIRNIYYKPIINYKDILFLIVPQIIIVLIIFMVL